MYSPYMISKEERKKKREKKKAVANVIAGFTTRSPEPAALPLEG
jgi:hypothetical protein